MTAVDPITLQLVRAALDGIGEEMALTVVRTAYSTVVRDNMDFSTALCTADGDLMAQGPTIPFHLGSVPAALRSVVREYGHELAPGDIFILNDPYDGGMHLPDIFMFTPVFTGDTLLGFSACVAHHTDVGGRVAGSNASDSTEIYQEGIRIPALRLARRHVMDETFLKLVLTNVRVPDKVMGDLRAQMSACHTGERGLLDLVDKYGKKAFLACAAELLAYSERMCRASIARFPDGRFEFSDFIDDDGLDDRPIRLQVAIEKTGDRLRFDFTGTSPQVRGAINAPIAFTKATVYGVVRCLIDPATPNNGGMFRPIEVHVPPATVLSAEHPAAVAARGLTGFRLYDTLFGAFARMLPDAVFAAGEGGNTGVSIGGHNATRGPYVFVEFFPNCWGARPDSDGVDGITIPLGNLANTPVEAIEAEYPLRVEEYAFVADSGGAGTFRGGVAASRSWRLLEGRAVLNVRSDRHTHRPYGLYGGESGQPSQNILNPDGSHAEVLPSKLTREIREGDLLWHSTAGAGGWGNPWQRDPERVVEDVLDGKVSAAGARAYGVVIDADGALDAAATAALRAQLAARHTAGSSSEAGA